MKRDLAVGRTLASAFEHGEKGVAQRRHIAVSTEAYTRIANELTVADIAASVGHQRRPRVAHAAEHPASPFRGQRCSPMNGRRGAA